MSGRVSRCDLPVLVLLHWDEITFFPSVGRWLENLCVRGAPFCVFQEASYPLVSPTSKCLTPVQTDSGLGPSIFLLLGNWIESISHSIVGFKAFSSMVHETNLTQF